MILHIPVFFTWKVGGERDWMSKSCWKETTPCNSCYKIFVWPHHTRLHLHKKCIAISKIQTLLTNAISLPSLKSLVAPPNFCCLNCAEWFDLIWFDYCTIDSSHELQRAAEHLIDSTKKTFVSYEFYSPHVIKRCSNLLWSTFHV